MIETVQDPPPLIQNPNEPPTKPIKLSQKTVNFDMTKVLAAVGIILVVMIVIVGIMWILLQNLESRVNSLEQEVDYTNKVATGSAHVATHSATTSSQINQ